MDKTIPQKLSREISQKYSIVNNSFRQIAKNNPKDLVVIEIGDTKQADFFPQVKINRWGTDTDNNEVNASFRLLDFDNFTIETDKDKIRLVNGTKEVEMYDLPPGEGMEDGGFEFNTILKVKPATNVLNFSINVKGLNFFFQPPLTQQELDEGASRPENVVGSYAVYHATRGGMNDIAGMEYKTGKAFHIYRPKVIDANGVGIWGDLNIDEQNGLLTVVIDQNFLDNAVYPVIVDPTFGYTSLGVSTLDDIANAISDRSLLNGWASDNIYLLSEAGTLDSISVGLVIQAGGGTDALDVSAMLFREDSAGADSHDKVVGIERANLSLSETAAFYDFTAASESLTADNYILAALGNGFEVANTSARVRADSGGTDIRKYLTSSTGSGGYGTQKALNPWNDADSADTFRVSIYATYTAAGGVADTDDFFHFFPLGR